MKARLTRQHQPARKFTPRLWLVLANEGRRHRAEHPIDVGQPLNGEQFKRDGRRLAGGDSLAAPAVAGAVLTDPSADCVLLDVVVPR